MVDAVMIVVAALVGVIAVGVIALQLVAGALAWANRSIRREPTGEIDVRLEDEDP